MKRVSLVCGPLGRPWAGRVASWYQFTHVWSISVISRRWAQFFPLQLTSMTSQVYWDVVWGGRRAGWESCCNEVLLCGWSGWNIFTIEFCRFSWDELRCTAMLFEKADRLAETPVVMRYYCVVDPGERYLQLNFVDLVDMSSGILGCCLRRQTGWMRGLLNEVLLCGWSGWKIFKIEFCRSSWDELRYTGMLFEEQGRQHRLNERPV